MDILFFQGRNYVSTVRAAETLNVSQPQINYYIKKGILQMVRVDNIKLIELDSLMLLNEYIFFRNQKTTN